MKLAVVSDIHGNLLALQAVLADIAGQQVDGLVNLGDILSGPLQPRETAQVLMARTSDTTIAGNHERQLLQQWVLPSAARDAGSSDGFAAGEVAPVHVRWLQALPPVAWVAPDVLAVHGTPASDLQYWLETVTPDAGAHGGPGMRAATDDEVRGRLSGGAAQGVDATSASLVLCGHTHVPRTVLCGATLIVNPGSVGLQAYDDAHPHWHAVENGSPHARYAVVTRGAAGWQVEHRQVPYDHLAAARMAAARGRADWAHALATGRMPPRA